MIAAHLNFTVMILLVKYAQKIDLSKGYSGTGTWETVLIRSLPMALIFTGISFRWHSASLHRGEPSLFTRQNMVWLVLRGILGTISMFCYFYGTLHIPLAVTSLFANTNVFFIAILSHFFLNEKMTRTKALMTLAGFAGTILILAQNFLGPTSSSEIANYMITFMTGALAGVAYFSIRRMKMIPGSYIIASLAIFGVVTSTIAILVQGAHFPTSLESSLLLWASAVPAIIGQWFMTKSFQSAEASYVSLGQFTAPVFAALSAYFLFSESLTPIQILGMGLAIMFGAAIPLLRPVKNQIDSAAKS
jgi:drug/metabolite transporter (DMT)-like permease